MKPDNNKFCLVCGSKGGQSVGYWHKPNCAFYKPFPITANKEETRFDSTTTNFEKAFNSIFC